MRTLPLVLFALALVGCETTKKTAVTPLTPSQTVMLAAEKPEGVTGTFEFIVRGSGRQDERYFLNSEVDYRDQRCLTLVLTSDAYRTLSARLGDDAASILNGKKILVNGTARKTRIDFISMGRVTDKYYYQTHVAVGDAGQIRTVN